MSWCCNCSFSRGAPWRTTGKCRCGVIGRQHCVIHSWAPKRWGSHDEALYKSTFTFTLHNAHLHDRVELRLQVVQVISLCFYTAHDVILQTCRLLQFRRQPSTKTFITGYWKRSVNTFSFSINTPGDLDLLTSNLVHIISRRVGNPQSTLVFLRLFVLDLCATPISTVE